MSEEQTKTEGLVVGGEQLGEVDGDALAEVIRRVSPFMSTSVDQIDGIYAEASAGKLKLTATDGYQMGHVEVELPFPDGNRVLNGTACKDFADRHYNGAKLKVSYGKPGTQWSLEIGEVVIPFSDKYPAYDKQKPTNPETIVIFDPKKWIKAIRQGKSETVGIVYDSKGCR